MRAFFALAAETVLAVEIRLPLVVVVYESLN